MFDSHNEKRRFKSISIRHRSNESSNAAAESNKHDLLRKKVRTITNSKLESCAFFQSNDSVIKRHRQILIKQPCIIEEVKNDDQEDLGSNSEHDSSGSEN